MTKLIMIQTKPLIYGLRVWEILLLLGLLLLSFLELILWWQFTFMWLTIICFVLCYRFGNRTQNMWQMLVLIFKYYIWEAQNFDV